MLKQNFTPPVLVDSEQTRQANTFFWLVWGLIGIVTVGESIMCLALPQNAFRWMMVIVLVDGACLTFLVINRLGKVRLASQLLVLLMFVISTGMAWTAGGISAHITYAMLLIPLIAGLLLGWRAGVVAGGLLALIELGFVWAQHAGYLPPSTVHHTLTSLWVGQVGIISLLLLLQFLAVANITKALETTKAELARRRQAEASLRQSEEFRRRIFDSSHVPIVVIDAATFHFVDGNPAAVHIYRFPSRESCLGKTVLDVSAPVQYDGTPSSEKARQFIAQAVAQGAVIFEWRHRRPDGEEWDAEVHLMSFQSDGRPYLQFTLEDITGRKQAEAQLRRNETQLRAILESTDDGILAVDNAGERVIASNRRFGELWNIPQSLVDAGDNQVLLNFVRDQLSDPDAFLKKAVPISGTKALSVEILAFKDGRLMEHHGFPILLDGAVIGRVSSFRDITERQRTEAELTQHRQHLEELVKVRTAELQQVYAATETAYRKLVELEKLRDDLVHMVVHDMRSPLTGLEIFLELLSPAEVNRPEFEEDLHLMRLTSQALSEMVTTLLDVSRLESGQMPTHCEHHNLEQLAHTVLERLDRQTRGRRVAIRTFESPVLAYCDRAITERIIQNLLSNALKFTPAEGTVTIELTLESRWARITITDTGPGIPAEYHAKVFEKFGQAEIHQNRKVPSSGLGLAFCKLAVEAQAGSIKLESPPGQGATFHVRLPGGPTKPALAGVS